MATIIYPTEKEQVAPWLIDRAKLDQLDSLVRKLFESLLSAREMQIKAVVQEEISSMKPEQRKLFPKAEVTRRIKNSYQFKGEDCRFIILLTKDRKVSANSIEEARKVPLLADEVPIGLELEMKVGRSSVELALGRYDRNKLQYNVNSPDSAIGRDVAYALESWMQSCKPPMWQRVWKGIQGVQIAILFALFIFGAATLPSPSKQYKTDLLAEVGQLLQKGVDPQNMNRALELILVFGSDYVPPKYSSIMGPYWKRMAIVAAAMAVLCIIISFPPRSNIGIGRGEGRIKFWRIYTRFISVSLPIGIVLPIVLNQIHIF